MKLISVPRHKQFKFKGRLYQFDPNGHTGGGKIAVWDVKLNEGTVLGATAEVTVVESSHVPVEEVVEPRIETSAEMLAEDFPNGTSTDQEPVVVQEETSVVEEDNDTAFESFFNLHRINDEKNEAEKE